MSPYWPLVTDLDRCEHGRHCIDPCADCPGEQSTGNPLLEPGQHIGYNTYGYKIVVPINPADRGDASKWVIIPRKKDSSPAGRS